MHGYTPCIVYSFIAIITGIVVYRINCWLPLDRDVLVKSIPIIASCSAQ